MNQEFMKRALSLAQGGIGKTRSNPLVGAVLVKDGKIFGEGFHTQFGKNHAEVEAIENARAYGFSLNGSTLYLNLEPCVHTGKTPPCVESILREKISKVVVGMKDPDRRVNGKGITYLRKNGIEVEEGILEEECKKLNRFYIKHRTTGLPYVILKIAATLDGKIADARGQSQWITGEGARCYVHRLRSKADAIIVGINTVLKDNPKLTVRLPGVEAYPLRVILDSHLKIPLDAYVLNDQHVEKTIIATLQLDHPRVKEITKKGAHVIPIEEENGKINLQALLKNLASDGVMSVMIEGGASTNTSFLKDHLVDQLDYFFAPRIMGGEGLSSIAPLGIADLDQALSFKDYRFERVGNDLLFEGLL